MSKSPVPIVDRNGKSTTVWKNNEVPTNQNSRSITLVPPKSSTPTGEPIQRFPFFSKEIRAFTEGDCWRLAHALHELTGWEIVALSDADEYEVDANDLPEDSYWSHMVVRHPKGYLVDIEGIYSEEDILHKWEPFQGITFEASDNGYLAHVWESSRLDPMIRARRIVELCEAFELTAS